MNEITFRTSWANNPEEVEATQLVNRYHDPVTIVCILRLITSSIDCISFDCSWVNFQWLTTFIDAKLCKTTYRCRQSIHTVEHNINICFSIFAWEHTCCYGNKPTHLSIPYVLREVNSVEDTLQHRVAFHFEPFANCGWSQRAANLCTCTFTHTHLWFSPTSLCFCLTFDR